MHSSLTTLLLGLLISTSLLALGHFYLWRRLIRDAALPRGFHAFATAALVLLAVSQPLVFVLARSAPRDLISPYAFIAYLWMGLVSTLFSLVVLVDLGRWLYACRKRRQRSPAEETVAEPERRKTFGRLLASGVALTGGALVGVGVKTALDRFRLVPVEITLDKLPPEFDGFRIVQLSDIHIGPTIGRSFIESMVESANGAKPDLIAITGDLVDGSVEHLGHHAAPLRALTAPHGTYFVTGNHEYYSGADEWIAELDRLGIPTLRNERVEIRREDACFDLVGVTDHRAGSFGDAPDLSGALHGRDPSRELVLLAHQPAEVYEAEKHDVGLQLSGHTHGGQFWPWNWVIYLVQPVVRGLARFGRTQIYVNTGTGYWGPPVRLGTEPEITVVTLRSKTKSRAAHA